MGEGAAKTSAGITLRMTLRGRGAAVALTQPGASVVTGIVVVTVVVMQVPHKTGHLSRTSVTYLHKVCQFFGHAAPPEVGWQTNGLQCPRSSSQFTSRAPRLLCTPGFAGLHTLTQLESFRF